MKQTLLLYTDTDIWTTAARTSPKVCLPLHRQASIRQASAAPEEALQFCIGLLFVCVWITTLSASRSKTLCQGPLETRRFQHQSLAEIGPSKCKLIFEDNVTSGTSQWDLLCFLSEARTPIGKPAQCFVWFLIIYSGRGSVSLDYQLLATMWNSSWETNKRRERNPNSYSNYSNSESSITEPTCFKTLLMVKYLPVSPHFKLWDLESVQ